MIEKGIALLITSFELNYNDQCREDDKSTRNDDAYKEDIKIEQGVGRRRRRQKTIPT